LGFQRLLGLLSTGGESALQRVQALEDLAKDATEWLILEDAADRGMILLTNEDFGRRWGGTIKTMKANGKYRTSASRLFPASRECKGRARFDGSVVRAFGRLGVGVFVLLRI
jgi:hypothetical protein